MFALGLIVVIAVSEVVCRFWDRKATLWQAVVCWEGDYIKHAARDEQEAREWLACYPQGTSGVIERVFHGRAYIVAARHA